ncbi:hypothetical protein GORHZ_083_00030 [Gordonia rhizosphera NBRC 16068]|uniref:Uncharacterized protein n=1 Tax=Gordonia rhizosphera NBRC 16068 TaxID=1108045 RepID=K6VT21_9ACTN|nr:hypothetical protein GORHZ_083_00030 [Gordonia rhizosphera NBRC 16068]
MLDADIPKPEAMVLYDELHPPARQGAAVLAVRVGGSGGCGEGRPRGGFRRRPPPVNSNPHTNP